MLMLALWYKCGYLWDNNGADLLWNWKKKVLIHLNLPLMQIWVWYEIQCINSDNLGELTVSFLCLSIIMTMATSSRRLSVKPDRRTKSSVPRHSSSVCSRWDSDGAFYTASFCVLLKLQVLSCAYPLTPMHSYVCCSCSMSSCRIRVPTWTERLLTWAASRSSPGALPSPLAWIRSRPERLSPRYTSEITSAVVSL